MKYNFLLLTGLFFLLIGCKEEKNTYIQPISGSIYEVDSETLYQSNVDKTKQKSSEQYISILYTNLNQNTISPNDLSDLSEVRLALGDKQLANELILNGFVNNSENIPSDADMRADLDQFVEDTYIRFFLRKPTAYEVFELKNEIVIDTDLSPDLIYQSFALSNEYQHY